jgi:hypothetical protein
MKHSLMLGLTPCRWLTDASSYCGRRKPSYGGRQNNKFGQVDSNV